MATSASPSSAPNVSNTCSAVSNGMLPTSSRSRARILPYLSYSEFMLIECATRGRLPSSMRGQRDEMEIEAKRGIQALEIGVQVFRHLYGFGRPVTLTELSEACSMHPSKLHRYCVSLIRS